MDYDKVAAEWRKLPLHISSLLPKQQPFLSLPALNPFHNLIYLCTVLRKINTFDPQANYFPAIDATVRPTARAIKERVAKIRETVKTDGTDDLTSSPSEAKTKRKGKAAGSGASPEKRPRTKKANSLNPGDLPSVEQKDDVEAHKADEEC